MKRAQRLLAHTVVAASLALAAGTAQAIPITFAFTAKVLQTLIFDQSGHVTYDPSHDGEAASGAIVVETEGLLSNTENADFGTSLSFFQRSNGGLFSSTLTIGGTVIDVGAYDRDSGTLRVIDSNGPCGDGCSFFTPDSVSVGHRSTNLPLVLDDTPLNGVFDSRTLSVGWSDSDNPLGLIDLSKPFAPLDLLNLSLGQPYAQFSQQVQTCTNDLCRTTRNTVTNFALDSFTVSAATTAVPEPGTLSLLLLGLLGIGGRKKWRSGRDSNPRPPA